MSVKPNAAAAAPITTTLRLAKGGLTDAGNKLGLRAGDCLIAVNGTEFRGHAVALVERFSAVKGRDLALTFRRGDADLTVLANRPDLGRWEPAPLPGRLDLHPINPDRLTNWEILRNGQGVCDLHPLRPSLLALALAPVWLMQMRLWATLATIVAAVAVGFAINPLIAAAIYLTVSLNLWRMAPHHVRLDRMARGFAIEAVVAATGETGAIAAYTELNPKARFVFGPQSNSGSADGGLAKAA